MKVAIVCDWLVGIGGAERVVYELHKMYPEAPIYTSQYDPKKLDWFKNADVRTLWLQKLPKGLRKFLPVLRAWSFSRLDLSGYDLVISSSGAEAKAVKTGPKTIHISYILSPTHYYWIRYDEYLRNPGFGRFDSLARLALKLLAGPMRRWDYRAAQRADYIVAISNHVQAMIKKHYNRDSAIIHPPVEVDRFALKPRQKTNRHGFLVAGRQTPYKRIDLAVAACTKLDLPLKVIGNGPDHQRLVKMAGPRVNFLTNVSDKDIPWHFQQAEAFIFPGVDDFGIVAVEALAASTPVIAYKKGGSLDYVKDGKTGMFFEDQSVNSLATALEKFRPDDFKRADLAQVATSFSPKVFADNIKKFIASKTQL